MSERDAIVAWLEWRKGFWLKCDAASFGLRLRAARQAFFHPNHMPAATYKEALDAIERGEHMKGSDDGN